MNDKEMIVAEYAYTHGIEPERVRYREGLARLRETGVFVGVSVRGISMFGTRVRWEELGIPENDVRRSRLGRGGKGLLPPYLNMTSLAVRVRQALDRHGLDVDIGLHGVRWLPANEFPDWKKAHTRVVALFDAKKQEILDSREETIAWLREEYTGVAEAAYRQLRSSLLPEHLRDTPEEDELREKFIARIVDGVVSLYPSQERIEDEVRVEYYCPLLVTPAEMMDVEERKATLTKNQWQTASTAAKLAAIRQAELEAARKRIAELGNPYEDAIVSLRAEVNERLLGLLQSVQKQGDTLNNRTLSAIENALGRFKATHALGDDELAEELSKVRDATAAEAPSTEAVIAALNGAVELTRQAAYHAQVRQASSVRATMLDIW